MHSTRYALTLLFGLRRTVTRPAYILWGLSLAALKYAIDTTIIYNATHKTWSLASYFVPSVILRETDVGQLPELMDLLLVVFSLPFLWVGLTMSVRRAADADISPWFGVLFLVPGLNYLTIAALSLLPSKRRVLLSPERRNAARPIGPDGSEEIDAARPQRRRIPPALRAALYAVIASVGVGVMMLFLSVYGLHRYGWSVFFLTPFTMGAVSALIYNERWRRRLDSTIVVALAGTALTGSICLLFAIEGFVCLAIAFPIAAVVSVIGAVIGWSISTGVVRSASSIAIICVVPMFAAGEARISAPRPRDVVTSIEVDAPP